MTIDEMVADINEKYPILHDPQIREVRENYYILNTLLPRSSKNKLMVLSGNRGRHMSVSFDLNNDDSVSFKFSRLGNIFPLLDTILL